MARFGRAFMQRPVVQRWRHGGPILYIQSALSSGWIADTGSEVTLTDVAPKSLLVLAISAWAASAPPTINTVSDTQGETWEHVLTTPATGNQQAWLYVAPDVAGGGYTLSVVLNESGNGVVVGAEYLVIDPLPLRVTGSPATNSGTSTTPSSGATTAGVNAGYLALMTHDSGGLPTMTPDAPWVLRRELTNGVEHRAISVVDVLNGTGAKTATWVTESAVAWAAGLAAFAPVMAGLKINTLALLGMGR